MKQKFVWITLAFSALFVLAAILYSCNKFHSVPSQISKDNKFEKPLSQFIGKSNVLIQPASSSISPNTSSTYGCGSSLSGNYYGTGYYSYPEYTIDVSSSLLGSDITLAVQSYDVPNKFTIYDSLGNVVASSNWMGIANYSGPWGMSLNAPETANLQWHYGTSANFTLRVETETSSYSDSWNATVLCKYTPKVVTQLLNDPTLSQNIKNAFDSMEVNVDMAKLSQLIGMGYTISDTSFDFANVYELYDTNDPDSTKIYNVNYKHNSSSSKVNYTFSFLANDTNFSSPILERATNPDSINDYLVNSDTCIVIHNPTTTSPIFNYYKMNTWIAKSAPSQNC